MSAYWVSTHTSTKFNSQIAIPFFLRMKEENKKKKKLKYILDLEDI